jgi:ribosomal protein S8E
VGKWSKGESEFRADEETMKMMGPRWRADDAARRRNDVGRKSDERQVGTRKISKGPFIGDQATHPCI